MRIVRNLRTSAYFNAKTNPESETPVLGREKTKTSTESKIPNPPNTKMNPDSQNLQECIVLLKLHTFSYEKAEQRTIG